MAYEPHPKLTVLFPELRAWSDNKGITVSQWLSIIGSIPHAVAYSSIFWPEFIEYEGCLLHFECDPTSFDEWMTSLNGDKTRVEAILNHIHLTDLFLNSDESFTDAQVEYLGLLLQDMWLLKLRRDFPHLDVQVEFYWYDRKASDDAQITVYCQRSTNSS